MQTLLRPTVSQSLRTAGFGMRDVAVPHRSQGPATHDVVTLVSGDAVLRRELEAQLAAQCLQVNFFTHLSAVPPPCEDEVASCVVLDSGSSGFSAGEMQQMLASRDYPPTIVIDSANDVRATVQAMKVGVYDYFPKPCEVTALLTSVRRAHS